MNHLAHFFLSGDDDDIKIGNFVADFISNKEVDDYTEGVQRGIKLHRAIDAFTDTHPIVKQSTKRLHPFHHKYSPVIVDIYYDYLLGKNWERFTSKEINKESLYEGISVRDYINNIYKLLTNRKNDLPIKLQARIDQMIADDWLMKYTTFEGLNEAFNRIEKYAAFPGNFGNAALHLEMYLEDFDKEFIEFFPELMVHVQQVKSEKDFNR